jgi:PPP family 3-phenylpropionic acid transporter
VIALRTLVLALGVALGVFYPFISVILAARGFSPGEIGLIASIGAVGFTLAVPAWGHLADVRLGRPKTLQVCAIGGALVGVALLVPWPAVIVAVLFWAFWIFESSWQPLSDAVTIITVRGRDYARIRLLTSLSFAVAAISAGFVYDRTGYDPAYALMAAAAVVMAVAAFRLPDIARADLAGLVDRRPRGAVAAAQPTDTPAIPEAASPAHAPRFGSSGVALRVAPSLALVLTSVGLLHIGIISGFTFLGLRITDLGGTPSDVALASGLSAGAEIPAMLVAGRVANRIGLRGLFVGSALLYAACLGSWTVLDQPTLIIATRALTGIAFAGVVVGVVLTIAALLPPNLQATGQSLYQTIAFGAAAIIANLIGGLLYQAVGHGAVFGVGALLAVAAAILGLAAFPRRAARPGASRASTA